MYMSSSEREAALLKERAKYEDVLNPFVPSGAPRPFTDEGPDLYRRRALPLVQQFAPNYQGHQN
jgi:hypothetical protein